MALSHSATSLRERLAEIENEMAQLATARKQIVDALESVVFPILTIPPEITAQFFMHYVDWVNSDLQNHRGGPLLLASVCRSWRNVALNFPQMWSEIHISNPREGFSIVEKRLRCWLQRTGGHALALDMASSQTPHLVFPMLAPHCMRWERFKCNILLPVTYSVNEIEGRLPLLRTLDLVVDKCLNSPITAFSNAPLLREAHLTWASPQWVILPWAQLTTMSFVGWEAYCLQILQQTRNLEVLTVTALNNFGPPWDPSVRLCLGRLHSLTIEYSDSNLLDFLTLPALTHLEIRADQPVMRPGPHLPSFIARSKCSLRSLSLRRISSSFGNGLRTAIEIIRCTPTVPELAIQISSLGEARRLLECIEDLLPNMRKLCIKTWSNPPPREEIVGRGSVNAGGDWTACQWLQNIQFVPLHSAPSLVLDGISLDRGH